MEKGIGNLCGRTPIYQPPKVSSKVLNSQNVTGVTITKGWEEFFFQTTSEGNVLETVYPIYLKIDVRRMPNEFIQFT